MKNKKILFILVILSLIFLFQNISAIGITPGRTTIDFSPNLQENVPFSVINSEHKNMSALLYVKGELQKYVTLNQELVSLSQIEESKNLSYKIDMPKILEPGLHIAEIVALEIPEGAESEGSIIGATVAVATQLYVYVPYPGKYLEADVNLIESNPGEPTTFIMPLINRGKQDIKQVKAVIEIYYKNELVEKIELEEFSMLAGERKELVEKWGVNADSGKYQAKIILDYDGEEKIIQKEFNLGEVKVQIELITVNDFTLGEIAKFNILVNNKWGEEIDNVYVTMIVYGLERDILAEIKSQSYVIPSLTRTEMISYWDTDGIKKGIYEGKLILNYGEEKSERNVNVKVSNNNIEVTGITGHVITKQQGRFNLTNLLIILVVVLIMGNIIWFFVVKRLLKRKNANK
ncbi:MAG: hypothetical protein KKF68_01610 [Nanoarchaeota archaeon]|nr:hypothetical protein [Nanoarchaeota archaeon]